MKKKKDLKFSRRTVMKGALAAGAMMSAGSIPSKLFAGEYNIPDPLKPLPTTGGNMRWIDSGDMKGVFWKKLFPEYAASRGITIEYDGLPWKAVRSAALQGGFAAYRLANRLVTGGGTFLSPRRSQRFSGTRMSPFLFTNQALGKVRMFHP